MQICEICGQMAQGNHFGVMSCRACAAFFRRAANSKWSTMQCLSRHCDGKNYHCKPCRLKRCLKVGMDTSKFQHDRDALMIPSRKRKIREPMEFNVEKPHFVFFIPDSPEKSPVPKTYVDLNYLVEKALEILKNGPEAPFIAENPLKRLGFGNNCMNMPGEVKKITTISQQEVTSFWEYHFLITARWLVYFDQFQQLETDLKLQILCSVWHVWGRLDKLMATALYRKRNKQAKRSERVVGDGYVTDVLAQRGDITWMTNCSHEQVAYFINGVRVWDLFHIIDILIEMDISETELNFMLAQLSFQYVSSKFGGKISELMEKFIEILTNNLHDYYVNERRMPRYSGRLMKMLKINGEIQENIRKYRFRSDLAKVFEVFNLEFSHPEMFVDTGFC